MNIEINSKLPAMNLDVEETIEVLAWVDGQTIDLEQNTFEKLFKHYAENGMPYGIAKARTGDPSEWMLGKLREEMGIKKFG